MPPEMPQPADAAFWRGEIQRAERVSQDQHAHWQEDLKAYLGEVKGTTDETISVNVDYYETEQKLAALFYDTPELQLAARGPFTIVGPQQQQPPVSAILAAHRALLNELLSPDYADALTTVHKAIKDCLCASGIGATKICYQATVQDVEPMEQPGAILQLQQPQPFPVHEAWKWERFSTKKLLIPADFTDTDYDKAPWLGMAFRMPLLVARREFNLPEDFTGTTTQDDKILKDRSETQQSSALNYVDGIEIWYYAALFDPDIIHPQYLRRHVLVDGVDEFVEKHAENPYQTLGPGGRLTADSMIGNPIHPLVLRDVPDSAYPPSDARMRRPLAKELNKFRTQMVQARDANRPIIGYDVDKLTPEAIARIVSRQHGDLIPLEGGTLAAGPQSVLAVLTTASPNRQDYIANDYIQRDLEKTDGLGPNQVGQRDPDSITATQSAITDRKSETRLGKERNQVLRWYLRGVAKFSSLVCRYMTPALAAPYIGPQQAQVWGSWNKQQTDGRVAFQAKADSQIKLDAAEERRTKLQLYQMTAQDPNVVRVELLKDLFQTYGVDPSRVVVEKLPEKGPELNFSFRFQGEDFVAPQAQQVREILAQGGITITQPAVDASATQMFQQLALGLRDASGKAVAPTSKPKEHGGPVEQVRGLSKQQGDDTGARPGAPSMEAA